MKQVLSLQASEVALFLVHSTERAVCVKRIDQSAASPVPFCSRVAQLLRERKRYGARVSLYKLSEELLETHSRNFSHLPRLANQSE